MLKIENLDVHYGGVQALKQVNIEINEGEIVAILGANGAGKSSLIGAISGLVKPSAGTISFEDEVISGKNPAYIVSKGIIQCPEGRMIFSGLSVAENLRIGSYLRKNREEIKRDYELVFSLFPRLEERMNQMAGTLSGGEQQMLAIGRALMAHPKMLLLDEPSLGLAPIVIREIFKVIKDINATGTTILLVEQNVKLSLNIASRAYVLELGSVELEGPTEELRSNDEIRKLYLGAH